MPHAPAAAPGAGGRTGLALTAALVTSFIAAVPAAAGTFTLTWDPVTDPALQGYRVYYGRGSRSYTSSVDVGPAANRITLQGLEDCVVWFAALKSLDSEGRESGDFSGEVSGFTRPSPSSVGPDLALPGTRVEMVLTGTSFQPGGRLTTSAGGVSVDEVQVPSCRRAEALVEFGAGAAPGAVDLAWINPDGVPGDKTVRLEIVTDPGPVVQATEPVDGAVDVALGILPRVQFDRELAPESVTPETVRVVDSGGDPVPQAAGSPALSGREVTVIASVPLAQGTVYHLQIAGGSSGVRDLLGRPAVSGFMQGVGFRMADPPPGQVPAVRRTDTKPPE